MLVPLLASLLLTWSDSSDSEVVWKAWGVGVLVATTLAQAALLLSVAHGSRSLRPLLLPTLALAGGLALVGSGMILTEEAPEGLLRLLGITAILDVLGTVVTIAIAVFGGAATKERAQRAVASPHRPVGTVELPAGIVERLDGLSSTTGRSRDVLAAEAVDVYLASLREAQSGM